MTDGPQQPHQPPGTRATAQFRPADGYGYGPRRTPGRPGRRSRDWTALAAARRTEGDRRRRR